MVLPPCTTHHAWRHTYITIAQYPILDQAKATTIVQIYSLTKIVSHQQETTQRVHSSQLIKCPEPVPARADVRAASRMCENHSNQLLEAAG
eukprot:6200723-Pleurochrysis_carterae.AAC.1